MVNKLLGKKIGMTRYFLGEGTSVSATVLKVGPCVVTQRKTPEKEGYGAIQVGFEPREAKRLNAPMKGHLKALGEKGFVYLREIRVDDPSAFELGQEIRSDIFQVGERVQVAGKSKGRGFAGVVKRWGFSGGRKSHGSRFHRAPGSIGTNTTPGRVLKGRKLPGRMGNQRTTVKNLVVIDVRPEMDVLVVRGAVPGYRNGLVEVSKV
jgi:large subunit ribosomal protein L3